MVACRHRCERQSPYTGHHLVTLGGPHHPIWSCFPYSSACPRPSVKPVYRTDLLQSLHERMDANHDGYVTFQELSATARSMVVPKGTLPAPSVESRVARRQFDLADADHDGRISLKEAVESADRSFADADTDHDGILSQEERGAYAAQILFALQAEMSGWKAPPCQAGAACGTALPRSRQDGAGSKRP